MNKFIRVAGCVLFILATLFACAPNQNAVVVERRVITQAEVDDKRIGGQFIRIVQPGDTLYSIAFVMNLDVNRIALWNGIEDTEKLLVGQRIRLTEPLGFNYPPKSTQTQTQKTQTQAQTKSRDTTSKRKPVAERTTAAKRDTYSKPQSTEANNKPRTKQETLPEQQNTAEIKNQKRPSEKGGVNKVSAKALTEWHWPLRGTLVERFDPSKGQQGIRIQGERDQEVLVSADGEVVYSGDSLRGYGNLIIIKHSDEFLSAYAHNDSILVDEGDTVKQGQAIAKLGGNLIVAPVAQFQIRKNGVPVDPLGYLE